MDGIKTYLNIKRDYVNNLIFQFIDEYVISDIKQVKEAIKYLFSTGGKRIRPILALTIGEIFNLPEQKIQAIAIAIEFIHNYSLVHDDLPAMDNDDYRRGYLTLHKKYSQDLAILVGDLLQTLAFDILSSDKYNLPLQLINYISKGIGLNGLIGGQVLDLSSYKKNVSDYFILNSLKTAKLIELSVASPIFVDNIKKDRYFYILKEIGFNLGMAFQVIDDIMDSDGICTVLDKEECREYAKDFTKKAIENIERLEKNEKLMAIAKYLLYRKF